jgi:hypothetical protein
VTANITVPGTGTIEVRLGHFNITVDSAAIDAFFDAVTFYRDCP